MSKEHQVTINGHTFSVFDGENSDTPQLVAREMNASPSGLFDLEGQDIKTIVDIGANVGIWAVTAAKLFPNATIHAIEAWRPNFDNLVRTIESNGLEHQILPYFCAITGAARPISFGEPHNNSGGTSFVFATDFTNPTAGVTLQMFLDHFLKDQTIDLLKMDVERMEYEIIGGFNDWQKIKHLSVELHGLIPYPEFLWKPALRWFHDTMKNIPIQGRLWTNDIESL